MTKSYTNPGGRDGLHGHTGSLPMFKPSRGANGENGMIEMYVQDGPGEERGPYKSSYQLRVVEFDIIDENEDGIYEFGETITMTNIRVKNIGD